MRRLTAAVGLALALASCGHSASFVAPGTGSDRPFAGGSPQRLTFNLGDDRAPAWLPDGSGLVYSFQRLDRPARDRCLGLLPPDVGRLGLSGNAASLAVIPGTRFASSVAAGESADIIYYTLGGDSRVYRRVLSSGSVSVAHDFGGGIARDVQVVGSRLIAVVGGD